MAPGEGCKSKFGLFYNDMGTFQPNVRLRFSDFSSWSRLFYTSPKVRRQKTTTDIAATLKPTTIKESVQRATEQKAVQDRYTARDDKRRTMCDTPTPLLQKTSDGIEKPLRRSRLSSSTSKDGLTLVAEHKNVLAIKNTKTVGCCELKQVGGRLERQCGIHGDQPGFTGLIVGSL